MGVPEITKQSGHAVYAAKAGYTVEVPSCADCAKIVGVMWVPGLFEGECLGCEIALSGMPNSR